MTTLIGQTLLQYRIVGKLGEGGMGVVYRAYDTKLDRTVALKFLPADVAASPHEITRLEQEAKAISALNHPNIATIYDISEADGTRFLVLEFIPNGTLKSKLRELLAEGKHLSFDEVARYGIQIAEGLACAHRAGIIHRDVKSDNAMLTSEGNVKLTDFGLAKRQFSTHSSKDEGMVGTAAYMSPEQIRGDTVDGRSDLFSLGVVLYELTTLRIPFRGEHEAALLYSIAHEEPQPATKFREHIPEALLAVIARCLEKDPAKRYQTGDDVARALRSVTQQGTNVVAQPINFRRQSKLPWGIAGTLLLLVAAAVFLFKPSTNTVGENDSVKTIAVLPFLDMSPNNDQEYFSNGLSEELLNVFAKNPKLRVTSRTSSFSFQGRNVDIKTIAAKLNVKHILEGSVRKSGNSLRITAQLIDVETDAHLWSDTYDGTLENIFAVQDTIAQSVAEALRIVLLGEETATRRRETHPQAYNAFLLGKHFGSQGKDSEKAARYFQQALAIDSSYAPAWVELSTIHSAQANDGTLPLSVGYEQARREAEKALALDPNLASAHLQIGWIKRRYDWDWSGADKYYQRALELDAGNARVVSAAAGLARTLGQLDESVRLMRRAVELNPVSASWHFNHGLYASDAGLLVESQAAFEKCLELNPHFSNGHSALGLVLLLKGKADSALAEIVKETEPDWKLHALAMTYHALGKKKESNNALAELIKEFQNEDAYQIAEIYAYKGETDKAFEWLERADNQRDGGLASIKGNRWLQTIRKDPRYVLFLKKLRLPS
jgi:serine/threonine-protein kinase